MCRLCQVKKTMDEQEMVLLIGIMSQMYGRYTDNVGMMGAGLCITGVAFARWVYHYATAVVPSTIRRAIQESNDAGNDRGGIVFDNLADAMRDARLRHEAEQKKKEEKEEPEGDKK